jgi:hypothetical protein
VTLIVGLCETVHVPQWDLVLGKVHGSYATRNKLVTPHGLASQWKYDLDKFDVNYSNLDQGLSLSATRIDSPQHKVLV